MAEPCHDKGRHSAAPHPELVGEAIEVIAAAARAGVFPLWAFHVVTKLRQALKLARSPGGGWK